MPTKRTWRFTLSTQVVLALVLGALVGLVCGEKTAFLQGVGKAFILLLQMTLLPYIVLSLITGLGHLHYQQVKVLALRVGTFLARSWGLAFVVILVMPLAFPTWQSASFFSTSLIEKYEDLDLFTLFIPSNPFHALSNNTVPAVVVFSVAVGVGLIGIENKQTRRQAQPGACSIRRTPSPSPSPRCGSSLWRISSPVVTGRWSASSIPGSS